MADLCVQEVRRILFWQKPAKAIRGPMEAGEACRMDRNGSDRRHKHIGFTAATGVFLSDAQGKSGFAAICPAYFDFLNMFFAESAI